MDSPGAIQIVTPNNHTFQVNTEGLQQILGVDDIKDRYVVAISISGAFRKGKSFLLNFILKYLYAQYKKHDVTNWIDVQMDGFKARGGRQPETTGIWIWSEIFTHDHKNGDKIAIILMDTQGIFDNRSSARDNITTFAVSMLLASVQCYNVMQNIQEDDLQNLELFAEYGRLAFEKKSDKPFQNLLFIVRDWAFPIENPYGNGKDVIDELLTETPQQSKENQDLRKHLKSAFKKIEAFLLPYPGKTVANGQYTGNIQEIDAEFVKQLEALIPLLCAPDNLVLKEIGGQKVQAHEFIAFLYTYVNLFNGETLPEPSSILEATALTDTMLLYGKTLKLFMLTLKQYIDENDKNENRPFLKQSELEQIYDQVKDQTISEFRSKPKLGDVKLAQLIENKLIDDMEIRYQLYKQENDRKKISFDTNNKTEIQQLLNDCVKSYTDSIDASLLENDSYFNPSNFQEIHDKAKNDAIARFKKGWKHSIWDESDLEIMLRNLESNIIIKYSEFEVENGKRKSIYEKLKSKSEGEIAKAKAESLAAELEKQRKTAESINKNNMLYNRCLNEYINLMHGSNLNDTGFIESEKLNKIHENAAQSALKQFVEGQFEGGHETMFESRLENDINTHFILIKHENDRKREANESAERMKKSNEALQKAYDDAEGGGNKNGNNLNIFASIFAGIKSIFSLF